MTKLRAHVWGLICFDEAMLLVEANADLRSPLVEFLASHT